MCVRVRERGCEVSECVCFCILAAVSLVDLPDDKFTYYCVILCQSPLFTQVNQVVNIPATLSTLSHM